MTTQHSDKKALVEQSHEDDELDLRELILPYLRFWPYYLGAIVLFFVLAWVYTSMQKPEYPVKSSILFVNDEGEKSSLNPNNMLTQLMLGGSDVDIDNEMQILKSREVLEKAIRESRYYVEVESREGLKPRVWYRELPFRISLDDTNLSKIDKELKLELTSTGDGKYHLSYPKKKEEVAIDKIPGTYTTSFGLLTFEAQTPSEKVPSLPSKFFVTIFSPQARSVKMMEKGITVERAEKAGTIANLTIQTVNKEKGEDFLTKLVEVYNRERAIAKNAKAQHTYDFINERIKILGDELSSIEGRLAGVKRDQGITGYSDLGIAVKGKAEVQKLTAETQNKLNTVNYLLDYVKTTKNQYSLIPSTLGLEDASLAGAVNEYNKMIFQRTNLLTTANETHPKVIAQNSVIEKARQNIIAAAEASKVGLEITLKGLSAQDKDFTGKIEGAPAFERLAGDIERERAIRNDLYLMLLTKREETSMQLAASLESAKVVNPPLAEEKASSPKKPIIYLAALLLALLFTTLFVYLWRLTRTKIKTEADVKDLTRLTLLGSVPRLKDVSSGELIVQTHGNDYTTEVFRNLRTNLSFVTQSKTPIVILVTSTTPAEGKTFIVSNLAISLSALDKKVLLVGLDIRNPQLARTFGIKNVKKYGVTDLLNDPSLDPAEYYIQPKEYPNLTIIQTGTIPPNPSELLARRRLDELFSMFREQFDYVLIESAPCGPVVDTLVLSRVADATVYVTRADVTDKKDFDYINYLSDARKLPNMSIVVNDVNFSTAKKGKHSYGYGYGYGYGYSYGYGYDKAHE